jgi:hypothetical protein
MDVLNALLLYLVDYSATQQVFKLPTEPVSEEESLQARSELAALERSFVEKEAKLLLTQARQQISVGGLKTKCKLKVIVFICI